MFDDPGRQLQKLAKLFCALGSFGSLISGIALLFQGPGGMVIGFFVLTFGLSMSWVFSLILYGIGKNLEFTEDIAEDTKRLDNYAHSSLMKAFNARYDAGAQTKSN